MPKQRERDLDNAQTERQIMVKKETETQIMPKRRERDLDNAQTERQIMNVKKQRQR